MKINLDDKAVGWFKKELDIPDNKAIRFYVRYGGDVNLKQGFSPAFTVDTVDPEGYSETQDGLTYYVDEKDLWYYEDNVLNVTCENDEIKYTITN
ncbi:HesB/YadR/YfhF family protein [Macrococcus equipercicus]|uniref:HesB/YadR/YfhF family protein n=1 Tax=Macrococcus equipercicus TaxID=69967 RepID=A0A9Q9BTS1_9STAP|nr:hypothetical protein [Macrococcus equipercicus]KAA1040289.1 hypothetical protein ERX35_004670 [Macrococcus equipercicus]UTH12767.1 hypothetical protein KFV11_05620 [Macrococcus equipercicus]